MSPSRSCQIICDKHRTETAIRAQSKAVSSLNHPNICTLYDIGQQDGVHFI